MPLFGKPKPPQIPQNWHWDMMRENNTFRAFNKQRRSAAPENDRRLWIGISGVSGPIFCNPDTNLLAIAPARHAIGKTASVVVPNVMTWPGPVVSTSTKIDVLRATAAIRSSWGTLWHWTPDAEPTVPGCNQLRWSPVAESADWDTALDMSSAMVSASKKSDARQSDAGLHFEGRAQSLLGVLLWSAARYGHDMRWVFSVITGQRLTDEIVPLLKQLNQDGHRLQLDILGGIYKAPDRERASVFSTAAVTLRVFERSGVLDSTDNPNFDMEGFVRGVPVEGNWDLLYESDDSPQARAAQLGVFPNYASGWFDTIYISAKSQVELAPIVVAFLTSIRAAVAKVRGEKARLGVDSRHRVLFALDEMATMAPIPQLPEILAIGGEGIVTLGVLQDMGQARQRWGEQGMALLSLFQNVLVFPGTRDTATINTFSELGGDYLMPMQTTSQTQGKGSGLFEYTESKSQNEGYERWKRLTPDEIANGNPERPDEVLLFPHGTAEALHIYLLPYWSANLWLCATVDQTKQWLVGGVDAEPWRYNLPLPELDRNSSRSLRNLNEEYVKTWAFVKGNWTKFAEMIQSRPQDGNDAIIVIALSAEEMANGCNQVIAMDHRGTVGEFVTAQIPPGVEPGMRVRLKGLAIPGRNGGADGDLYIEIAAG
ncbi:type IV secretory pathway TraG/TraD family ATPase VirD4 [Actinoplanes lutulentus]|uniref:Type IV secretory system conjugative DNA transfer VirD4/TraG family protein n=1 Tax=Actinoplanes lutulentus TaxID=1287878 RepID=A0A327Z1C6_9ACTN|nr:type IV secretory system conjugative DNA transfer family protein [Actinoplanes lutulentus]MBB2943280.1 type IV secretory pathway TraG/TraD family ATPase VirD4 [Actinoplanes lutulentus]RAK28340.1 type IV secretory system conjugative DNA transfer VirD4/TraG family protein [Actinoplanes lutulentus]